MNAIAPPHSKICGHHLERQAIVYVRQSTLQQTIRHPESTRLQYGLVDQAVALGWPRARVQVIDDDLGKSGSSAEGRTGFQRLVSEVSLNQVGLVLGIEMSRLARSCRDWYQLLEICGLFATLIGDCDGLYDPANYNDRLLLGLKGTMSEAELYQIKQRMLAGREAKAQRGELHFNLARGYVQRPSGEIVKDPDEQVQATIALVFEQFERLGNLNRLLHYLVQHHIPMPDRIRSGLQKGDLVWRRPNRHSLADMLHNPIYAGAYVYGRRCSDPRHRKPGRPYGGKIVVKPSEWRVRRLDQLPRYISWEQYERNQRQLQQNSNTQGIGAIRRGPSLLSGLVRCGRCGRRMVALYNNNGRTLRYECNQLAATCGEERCQSLVGRILDAFVTTQVLAALAPATLEISLQVAEEVEAEWARQHQLWQQRLARAHYQTERAARQYHAVEPENRLVARTLERDWEEALRAEAELKADYERFAAQRSERLSATEREQIRRLASDLPALWHAATTTAADRCAVIRQLIESVTVTVRGETELVDVGIRWIDGQETRATITRPVAREDQLSYYPQLRERVAALVAQGHGCSAIARILNAEGWRPPKRRPTFNAGMVQAFMVRQGLRSRGHGMTAAVEHQSDEWTIGNLAHELDVPSATLYAWLRRGLLTARRVSVRNHALLLVHATTDDLARLRAYRHRQTKHGALESTSHV